MSTTQKRILLSVAGLKDTDKAHPDIELSEHDGRLNIQFAKRMLRWLAEGVRRGLELSGGSETPKDVAALLNMLLANMGESYIEVGLDAGGEASIAAESAKREPDLSYLPHLKTAISIMHLMQLSIETVLVPLAASSITIRREMEKNTRSAVTRMEDQINTIEQRTVDAVLSWTTRLLSNQTRNDFRPRDETLDHSLLQLQTPTCDSVYKFLASFQSLAAQTFNGTNLRAFLTEIAVGFRTQLLDHFRKFQVNATGALMVTKDMTRYIDLLRSWSLESSFAPSLEILAEIGNLFVIGPEALRERLRDGAGGGALAGVGKDNLRPYVLRREDYMSVGIQSVLNSL